MNFQCNHGERVADEKVDTADVPEKGDAVLVKFAGIYSHQGGPNATGFHMVEVKGRNGHLQQAHIPPEGVSIQVLEKALPPEPPYGACVMDGAGLIWQRISTSVWQAGPSTRSWRQLQDRGKLTRLHPEPADAKPLSAHDMWVVWDKLAHVNRPVNVGRQGAGVTIGAAAFDSKQARTLAWRILATVGWE